MSDVTEIMMDLERGDHAAAEKLLPLVYDELRRLAAAKLAQEKPGQTLQATALVHEAYLKLVGGAAKLQFQGRNHFFAVAAEAMRRILIDAARRKGSEKWGGQQQRADLHDGLLACVSRPAEAIAVDEALDALAQDDPLAAQLVKLRYFGGFTLTEAGELLGMSRSTANRLWAYARAALRVAIADGAGGEKTGRI